MKRLIRFMSQEELESLLEGDELENDTKFEQNGSEGFCFFDMDDIDPFTAQHILTGIATMDFVVEFMVKEETFKKMTKAKGRYHLPNKPMFETTDITEYSITKYNRGDFFPWQIWRLYVKAPVFAVHEEMNKTIISLNNEEKGDEEKSKNRHAF